MSLFIGRIPRDMKSQELENTFSKFGKFTRFDIKHNQGYGFIEFEDKRDAEDAIKQLKDAAFIVEWAKGGHRPGTSECFHCGETGHWARDCSKAPPRERRSDGGGRRDGGRGYDRDRRTLLRDRDRRDDRGRDRSPRRNDDRGRGSDRRDSDRRNGDSERRERRDRDDDRRERRDRDDDRRERRDRDSREERRRDDDRAPPSSNKD